MRKKWYNLVQSKGAVTVNIHDEIGFWGVTAGDFIKEINAACKDAESLTVHINSPGGSVFDGLAIYNRLKSLDVPVTTVIDGYAASIASIIYLAGDTRKAPENSYLMIHNPWMMTCGDADTLRKEADVLEQIGDTLTNVYIQNSNLEESALTEMMNAETWITATEAKEYGFVTDVTDSVEIAASFDTSKLKNIPEAAQKIIDAVKPDQEELKDKQASADLAQIDNFLIEQFLTN